jgi:alpha-glucosidase
MYQEYTPLIREAINLRYRLMPYFYSLMREAHQSGHPIMRPTFYEFQHDCMTYEQSVDFMLGSSLLVANVVEESATSRKVYLPNGANWYDFYTMQKYAGGQEIEILVDLSSIPLFIRDSAIIPLTIDEARLRSAYFNHLKLLIGGENSKFQLYQDDGLSQAYKDGNYSQTTISVVKSAEQTQINFEHNGKIAPQTQYLELELINQDKGPYWLSSNGNKLQHFLHRAKFDEAQEGWYYSNRKGSVEIKLAFPNCDSQIIVSFAHFDLIGM